MSRARGTVHLHGRVGATARPAIIFERGAEVDVFALSHFFLLSELVFARSLGFAWIASSLTPRTSESAWAVSGAYMLVVTIFASLPHLVQ